MLFKIFGQACILLLLTIVSASAQSIDRFVVVVPIYRELYSQNIGLLLRSLQSQNLDGLSFSKVDVYFVVNNTVDASKEAKIENAETVKFLNDLAVGKRPSVNDHHPILKEVAQSKVSERLNFHVMDLTYPGMPTRNIGVIRDLGVKEVLKSIPSNELKRTLIAHMDGDSNFPATYVRDIVKAFEVGNLSFALLAMYYGDQPEADARVYQRKITTDFGSAAYQFRQAADGGMPGGGGPRIVATAEAMKKVGGVPHKTLGEDCALIEKLREAYPKSGRFLGAPVFANYRAREDSYDGKIYLERLADDITFDSYEVKHAIPILKNTLRSFEQNPLLNAFYQESFEQLMREYQQSASYLRRLIEIHIDERHLGTKLVTAAHQYPALLNNAWFIDRIDGLLATHGYQHDQIISELTNEFPYYLSNPPKEYTVITAQIRAATSTVLMRPFILADNEQMLYPTELQGRMPKFSKLYREHLASRLNQKLEQLSAIQFIEMPSQEQARVLNDLRWLRRIPADIPLKANFKTSLDQVTGRYLNSIATNEELKNQAQDLIDAIHHEFDLDWVREQKINQFIAQTKKRVRDYSSDSIRLDSFFELNPSLEEVARLEYEVNKIWFATRLRNEAYQKVKTAAEFIEISKSNFEKGSSGYLQMIDETIQKNLDRFLRLKPSDEEMVSLVKKMTYPKTWAYGKVLEKLAASAKNRISFEENTNYAACQAALHRHWDDDY